MAQVTQSLIDNDFKPAIKAGKFPPATVHEVDQLIHAWEKNKALRAALQEIRDMHDGEEDVEDGPDGIANRPNRAMRVNQIIDAVL